KAIGLLDLRQKAVGERTESLVEVRRDAQLALRDRQPIASARAVAGQKLLHRMRGAAKPLRRPRDRQRGAQVIVLSIAELRATDLVDLVREQLCPARALARIAAEPRAFILKLAHRAMRVRGALPQLVVASVRIERVALHRRPRETEL